MNISSDALRETNTSSGICFMKIMLALFVTMLHLQPLDSFSSTLSYYFTASFFRIAVPGFFFITGFLYELHEKRYSEWHFVKRRSMRLIVLYTLWTLFLMPAIILDFAVNPKYQGYSILIKVLIFLRRFVLIGSWTPFWFFLSAIHVTILLYALYRCKMSEKCIITLLFALSFVLSLICDCYSPIGVMVGKWLKIDFLAICTKLDKIIGPTWKYSIWGCAYTLYGVLFAKKYKNGTKSLVNNKMFLMLALCIGIIILFVEVIVMHAYGARSFSMMASIAIILPAMTCLFLHVKPLNNPKIESILKKIPTLIYGYHVVLTAYVPIDHITNSALRYFTCMSMVFSVSFITILLSRRIKILKYLI